jgi:DUF1680 family protein
MKQLFFAAPLAALAMAAADGQTRMPAPAVPASVSAGETHRLAEWHSEGVIFLDHSLNARLHTVPVEAVHLGSGFWTLRRQVTTERSLPATLAFLEDHGIVDNFLRVSGRKSVPRKGPPYSDADVYEWIEAAAWAVASNETPVADKTELRNEIDSLTEAIVSAQDASGYLDTYYAGDKARLRFTDLPRSHEDYCLAHLIQAGIAYFRATGNPKLLQAGIRFANYVVAGFGSNKKPFPAVHPDLEMALVELYRTTGDPKYLEFTQYLFGAGERGGRPFTSRTEFEGNAVRGLDAASGATDYFAEAGDPAYKKTLDLLWNDLTLRKMYITGGAGSRGGGEYFGDAYELPVQQAPAATCAAVSNVMWNFRMLAVTGEARYADVLERALYNGANAGMSLSGTPYCSAVPLSLSGERLRNAWLDMPCCQPDVNRLLEVVPGYFYALSRNGVYLNLYQNSELDWHLEDGLPVKIAEATNYPWSGDVQVTVSPAHPAEFTVYLRWPGWAPAAAVAVNGKAVPSGSGPGSFIAISRAWQPGDRIQLSLALQPVVVVPNPRATDLYGHAALQRGPLVYAMEQLDQGNAVLGDLFLRPNGPVSMESRPDLLGGVTVLKIAGQAAERSLGDEPLYQPLAQALSRAKRPVTLIFIPYYTGGNREPAQMEIWVPVSGGAIAGTGFSAGSSEGRRAALR